MTGRIVRAADFERVLRLAPRAKSAHFAVHHLRAAPLRFVRKGSVEAPARAAPALPGNELSTAAFTGVALLVDDFSSQSAGSVPTASGCWLGTVVPKRHARRSVTRSLMKRQMHAAFERCAGMPGGLWVLRLRSGFDVKRFPSAASDALREVVRTELDSMLADLLRRLPPTGLGA